MRQEELKELIHDPSFFKDIKSEIKQGDNIVKKMRLNTKASTNDTNSVATIVTQRRRPKTANYNHAKMNRKVRQFSAKHHAHNFSLNKGKSPLPYL